jgi:4-hydroxy-3-polyprenylbenzoate decarboxylase
MAGNAKGRIVVGITGASGIQFGVRATGALSALGYEVHTIISDAARKTASAEGFADFEAQARKNSERVYLEDDIGADISSSSYDVRGMVVIPCSIKTLGEIASGIASNLISRSALNTLRMRKRLAIVLRESPLGMIELENALRITRAGGIIVPASPGFYTHPETVDDIIDFVVGKALDALEIDNELYRRWRTGRK